MYKKRNEWSLLGAVLDCGEDDEMNVGEYESRMKKRNIHKKQIREISVEFGIRICVTYKSNSFLSFCGSFKNLLTKMPLFLLVHFLDTIPLSSLGI